MYNAWQATRLVHSSTFFFFCLSSFSFLSLTFSMPFAVLSVVSKENENRKPKTKTAERKKT